MAFFRKKKEEKSEPKKEAKPEPKPEPKKEVKPEPKPEPKKEVKPEPKPEPKKEAKAEPKPKEDPAKKNGAYFVSTHPDGGWQVKKAGAQKALKKFKTKAEAEEYAKTVANNQGTNVVSKKKNGQIQKKH